VRHLSLRSVQPAVRANAPRPTLRPPPRGEVPETRNGISDEPVVPAQRLVLLAASIAVSDEPVALLGHKESLGGVRGVQQRYVATRLDGSWSSRAAERSTGRTCSDVVLSSVPMIERIAQALTQDVRLASVVLTWSTAPSLSAR
jgi:hypothetical protein